MSGISFGGGGRGVSFGGSGFLNSTSLSSNPLGAPPTYFNLSAVFVSDDLVVGSVVATISGNGDAPVTYSIVSDPDNKFVLDANGTDILLEAAVDFGVKQFHDLEIRAENAAGFCGATVRFGVTEATASVAPSDITLSASSIDENAGLGSIVATISVDGTPAPALSISADPDNKFDISGTDLILDGALDYETKTSHTVTIQATNGVGAPYEEEFTINVTEVGTVPNMATTLQSSVTYDGVTFFFSEPGTSTPKNVPVGQDVMGYPVALSLDPFDVYDDLPRSENVGGTIAHGMMLDPLVSNDGPQGFDELLADGSLAGNATPTPYSAALNVDPAINGNISIAAGSTHVLVKSVRRSGVTTPQWGSFEKFVPLTILPTAPRADFYRPAMSNPTQTLRYQGDVTLAPLRSLTPPASSANTPSWAAIEAFVDSVKTLPHFGPGGEKLRRYEFDNLNSGSGYSGDYGIVRAMPLYMLHSDALTETQKRKIIDQVIRNALDTIGVEEVNPLISWAEGAGQYHGYHAQAYFAAKLLDDADLLATCKTMRSNAFTHPRWVENADVGSVDVDFIGPSGQLKRFRDQFRDQDVGKPWWTEKWRGSQSSARYVGITLPVGSTEVFPVMLLQAGTNIPETGPEILLMGGPDDTTNWRAAVMRTFDYTLTTREPRTGRSHFTYIDGNVANPFDAREFYDITGANWRAAVTGVARWEGVPETIDYETSAQTGPDRVTAGSSDGELDYDWDIDGKSWTVSTRPITARYLAHSWDGIQFFDRTVSSRIGTEAGYPKGASLYTQYSEANALGRGKPTYIWPFTDLAEDTATRRNYVTVPGTINAGDPVNIALPKIMYRPYGAFGGNDPVVTPLISPT